MKRWNKRGSIGAISVGLIVLLMVAGGMVYREFIYQEGTSDVVVIGDLPWDGAWNTTVSELASVYAFNGSWLDWNVTVLELASVYEYNGTWLDWNSTVSDLVGYGVYGYVVDIVGSYCRMRNCSTGLIEYTSTDADDVFDYARGNLSSLSTGAAGSIFVKSGVYQKDRDFVIGHRTHLIGTVGVYFNVTANLSTACLVVDPSNVEYTDWLIQDIFIDMNGFNGQGVYTGWAGRGDMRCRETIDRLYIRQVGASYWAMWIYNPFQMYAKQIKISSGGNGIRISQNGSSDTFNVCTGNSVFDDIFIGTGSGKTGLLIETPSNTEKNPFNLAEFRRLQMGGGAYMGDASVGVNITNRGVYGGNYLSFYDIDVEDYQTGVYLCNASSIAFYGGWISGDTSTAGVNFTGTTTGVQFFGTDIDSWHDLTDGTRHLSMSAGHLWGELTLTGSSRFSVVLYYGTAIAGRKYYFTTYGTTASVGNGSWIAHLSDGTPTYVFPQLAGTSWLNGTYAISVYWVAVNSTHFQIVMCDAAGAAIPATRTITWTAKRLIANILDG